MCGLMLLVFLSLSSLIHGYAVNRDCDIKPCPAEGRTLVSVPWDCEKYVECNHGSGIIKHCPKDQKFDINRSACVNKYFVKCDSCDDSNSDENDENQSKDSMDRFRQFNPNLQHFNNSYITKDKDGIANLLRHSNQQNIKDILNQNLNVENYNLEKNTDDLSRSDEEDNFQEVLNYLDLTDSDSQESINYAVYPETSDKCRKYNVSDVTCPRDFNRFDNSVFISHRDDCQLYYQCLNGKPTCRECPGNLHFDAIQKLCTDPSKAKCFSLTKINKKPKHHIKDISLKAILLAFSIKINSQNVSQQNNCSGAFLERFQPDPSNCSKYYMFDGIIYIHMNCTSGSYFNPNTFSCEYTMPSGCDNSSNNYYITVQDYSNCSRYYIIFDNGQNISMECEFGLHFNPQNLICENPDVAGCWNGTVQNSTLTTIEMSPGNNECTPYSNNGYADLRPNFNDCTKYYVCDWGRLIAMDCPHGLHFNPILSVCDWPQSAGCNILA